MQGQVLEVSITPSGDELAAAHFVGDTVLEILDALEFPDAPGSIQIDGTDYEYTAIDRDLNTLTIGAPGLLFDYEEAQKVLTLPIQEEKWANVEIQDNDEPVLARISHTLYDRMVDGVREPEDQETAIIEIRDGDLTIVDLVNELPTVDGAYVREGTLPGSGDPTEPPGTSPDIVVRGTASALVVEATGELAPGSQINVYISTDPSFVPGPDTWYVKTRSTVVIVTSDATGTPLSLNTPYYVIVIAENVAGPSSDLSNVAEGLLDPTVVNEQIAVRLVAGFILAGRIQVGQAYIDANEGIVIPQPDGGTITFPVDGSFAEITAHMIAKSLTVEDNLKIQGNGQLLGDLELANGIVKPSSEPNLYSGWRAYDSVLNGDGADTTDKQKIFSGLADYDSTRWAVAVSFLGGGVRLLDKRAVGDSGYSGTSSYALNSYPDPTRGQPWTPGFAPYGGLARIGNYWYLLGTDSNRSGGMYIYRILRNQRSISSIQRTSNVVTVVTTSAHGYTTADSVNINAGAFHWANIWGADVTSVPNSTTFTLTINGVDKASESPAGAIVDAWQKVNDIYVGTVSGSFGGFQPRIGTNGTNPLMVWSNASNIAYLRTYEADLSGTAAADRALLTLSSRTDWGAVVQGPFGAGGATRLIIQSEAGANFVFRTDTWARVTAEEFSRANSQKVKGMAYDPYVGDRGERLVSYDNYGRFYRYSRNATALDVKAQYTWYDGVGTTHETEGGPIGTYTLPARRFLTMEAAPAPDINNTDPANLDKANRHKFYLCTDGGTPRLETTLALGTRTAEYDEISNTGATPPVTNGFASAGVTPGSFRSGALAPDGLGRMIELLGSGTGRIGPWKFGADGKTDPDFGAERPGTIFMWPGFSIPLDVAECAGQAVPRPKTSGAEGAAGNPSSTSEVFRRVWEVIGTRYGAGDGSTTFNLPDLVRRVPVGAGGGINPGRNDGVATQSSRTFSHRHGAAGLSNSTFTHTQNSTTAGGGSLLRLSQPDSHTHTISGQVAASSFDDIPNLCVRFVIKL